MKEPLLSLLENSHGYTLAVADAVPVKPDNFKPVADTWSFREQVHPIAYGIEWWKENYVKGIKTSWELPATSKSRKEAVAYLNQAYNSLKGAVKNTSVMLSLLWRNRFPTKPPRTLRKILCGLCAFVGYTSAYD